MGFCGFGAGLMLLGGVAAASVAFEKAGSNRCGATGERAVPGSRTKRLIGVAGCGPRVDELVLGVFGSGPVWNGPMVNLTGVGLPFPLPLPFAFSLLCSSGMLASSCKNLHSLPCLQ